MVAKLSLEGKCVPKPSLGTRKREIAVHLHESIGWAFKAMVIAGEMLPKRGTNFTLGWDGIMNALNEGHLQISVTGLLEQVELGLKERLTAFLGKTRGPSWWATLSGRVRQSAAARHRWSTAQLGARAVTRYPDAAWLTMGDVILVLDSLPVEDWRACLDAESRQKSAFRRVFYRIKGFRDYYVAHPKPHRTSTESMLRLCLAVRRIPLILRPAEWQKATRLLDVIRSLPKEQRSSLHSEAGGGWTKRDPRVLEVRVADLRIADPEGLTGGRRLSAKEKAWRAALLRSCVSSDATGKVFFGLGALDRGQLEEEK
jgi:hypothetical protein